MKYDVEHGFTLIELLVVIAIIGVLSGVALPHFFTYRAQGYDEWAQVSLRNVATAEEAYYIRNSSYKNCDQSTCSTDLPGLGTLNRGIFLEITATTTGFSGTSTHQYGTGEVFNWPL